MFSQNACTTFSCMIMSWVRVPRTSQFQTDFVRCWPRWNKWQFMEPWSIEYNSPSKVVIPVLIPNEYSCTWCLSFSSNLFYRWYFGPGNHEPNRPLITWLTKKVSSSWKNFHGNLTLTNMMVVERYITSGIVIFTINQSITWTANESVNSRSAYPGIAARNRLFAVFQHWATVTTLLTKRIAQK